MSVLNEIRAERRRQVETEGWTHAHDDAHSKGELCEAAASYAYHAGRPYFRVIDTPPSTWPWEPSWWKPSTRRRDLVKAAALIVAEIERLDRAATQGKNEVAK